DGAYRPGAASRQKPADGAAGVAQSKGGAVMQILSLRPQDPMCLHSELNAFTEVVCYSAQFIAVFQVDETLSVCCSTVVPGYARSADCSVPALTPRDTHASAGQHQAERDERLPRPLILVSEKKVEQMSHSHLSMQAVGLAHANSSNTKQSGSVSPRPDKKWTVTTQGSAAALKADEDSSSVPIPASPHEGRVGDRA
ncbi:hypothetical protein P4O66_011249, partial [Electrophorus voltai]